MRFTGNDVQVCAACACVLACGVGKWSVRERGREEEHSFTSPSCSVSKGGGRGGRARGSFRSPSCSVSTESEHPKAFRILNCFAQQQCELGFVGILWDQ